jgi:hypothetical protein
LERDLTVLELGPDATPAQVKSAYLRLKKLYSADSPLLSPIARDFPEEKRLRILLEVEEAYHRLLGHFHDEQAEESRGGAGRAPVPADPAGRGPGPGTAPAASVAEPVFSGPVLRKIREDLGIPLQAIFQATKVRVEQLEAIESESFEKLPDETYLRIQLKEYAGHLLLNPKKVIVDYLKRFAEWRKIHPPPGRQ